MSIGRREDLVCSIFLILPLVFYVSAGHDTLYTGGWYLIGFPLLVVVWGLFLGVRPLFLTGATAAAVSTLAAYICIQFSLSRPEGLLAFGHLLSVPGMALGMAIMAKELKFRMKATLPWLVAALGFLGAILGFTVAQIIVCNSFLFYCGALSLWRW